MDRFFIVTNDGKDPDFTVTDKVKSLLLQEGKTTYLCEKNEDKRMIKDTIPDDIDCVIVIGGDGSLIEAARVFHAREVPILGINMGTLGYLTEVEVKDIGEALKKLAAGDYALESRMMIEGAFKNGEKDVALNDIVVSSKGVLRVPHFKLYVNGELLNSYEADGIIISTPTGSTAYNLSAGGPIVEPTASMIVITPICSHALNTSSIVLSAEDEIVIGIGRGRNGTVEEVFTTFDGADMVSLKTGERVVIRRSDADTKLVKLSKIGFLEILRRKRKGS